MLFRFIKPVYAHCDVPCGIYETDTAKHAAATCLRMVEKIEALGVIDTVEKQANFARMVATKDAHAQKVKAELSVLWTDYFKPEHLEKLPEIHTTIWQAAKQASKVKQTVSQDECNKLIVAVDQVAVLFEQTK